MNCSFCKRQMANALSEEDRGIVVRKRVPVGYACVNPKCKRNGKVVLFSGELLSQTSEKASGGSKE